METGDHEMVDVYLVFDKLPGKADGGLVATYANFVEEFKGELQVRLVSVFSCEPTDIDAFKNLDTITLVPLHVDNRFPSAFRYFKHGQFSKFLFAILSGMLFFLAMPLAKMRSRRLLEGNPVIASSPAAAMFLSKKIKYILEVHSDFDYFWGRNPLGRLQGAIIPDPHLVLFRNSVDAAKGRGRFRSGFIHNCFDADSIAPSVADAATRGSRALFVGRLTPSKDPLRLLRCAVLLRQMIPDFELDIFGEGEMRDELQQAIANSGAEHYIRLCGFASDKGIYRNYSLLWLTSLYEGFGLVLIEAMANGTPVITTRWGDAVSEIVSNGETGFIVDSDEEFVSASAELLKNPTTLSRFSRNAIADFEKRFTRERNKRAWEQVLFDEFGVCLEKEGDCYLQVGELPGDFCNSL